MFFGWLSASSLRVLLIVVVPRLINLRMSSRSIQKVKHPHLRLKKARSQNWDERPDLMSPNMRCRSADHTPTHGRGNGKARSPQEVAAEPGVPGGLGKPGRANHTSRFCSGNRKPRCRRGTQPRLGLSISYCAGINEWLPARVS
jgi:hypothetical protein